MKSRSSDIFAQLFAFRKFLSMNFFQVIIDLLSSFSIVDLTSITFLTRIICIPFLKSHFTCDIISGVFKRIVAPNFYFY